VDAWVSRFRWSIAERAIHLVNNPWEVTLNSMQNK